MASDLPKEITRDAAGSHFYFSGLPFLVKLPRSRAALPLLIGATCTTLGQTIELGPFHFTIIRILIAVGVLRVVIKGESLSGGWNTLDRLMALWGLCAVFSACFHENFTSALTLRLGFVFNSLGFYFLWRVFLQDAGDILAISKVILIILVPIALEMVVESKTGTNNFSVLFGGAIESEVRDGKIRAQGPFLHSILAGTVGAACLPLALLFLKKQPKIALVGFLATITMVLTSRSSGPIVTAAMGLSGLALWKFRSHLRMIRWTGALAILGLGLAMNAPIYYVLSRIDLTGSSSSWHRAALIEASIKHLDEWWLGGTDHTRHWMPTGVDWSADHTDITNHYIKMGVLGGLPLMLLFMGSLASGFARVGKAIGKDEPEEQFLFWTFGSILFAHSITFLSVCYFDQSIIFLYLVLAAIGSAQSLPIKQKPAPIKPKVWKTAE